MVESEIRGDCGVPWGVGCGVVGGVVERYEVVDWVDGKREDEVAVSV